MGVQLSWDEHRACMKRERGERKACKRLRILADSPKESCGQGFESRRSERNRDMGV